MWLVKLQDLPEEGVLLLLIKPMDLYVDLKLARQRFRIRID
jgi:hypothetical protein